MTVKEYLEDQRVRLADHPSSRRELHIKARNAHDDYFIHGPETRRVGGVGFAALVSIARGEQRTRYESDCINRDRILGLERFIERVRSVPDLFARNIEADISSAQLV